MREQEFLAFLSIFSFFMKKKRDRERKRLLRKKSFLCKPISKLKGFVASNKRIENWNSIQNSSNDTIHYEIQLKSASKKVIEDVY